MITKWEALVLNDVMATREGVVSILNRVPNVKVTRVCETPEEALEQIARTSLNLALIELQLGQENGILLGRKILKLNPDLKVIIYTKEASIVIAAEVYRHEYLNLITRIPSALSEHTSSQPATSSLALHGYTLLKNIIPDIFEHNLNLLKRFGSFMDPEISGLLTERLKRFRLTPRELQCSEMIGWGKSNREIAEELGITRQAVENLINSLYHKLAITGDPKDPSRRVTLALAMQRWRGLAKFGS